MRRELITNPLLLAERIGDWAKLRRRLRRLRQTPAHDLNRYQIDSLELLHIASDRFSTPPVIFDVGANRGHWVQLAKSVFPQANIHAFEPIDELEEEFAENTATLEAVTLHQIALGDENTSAEININSIRDTSSLLEATALSVENWSIKTEFKKSITVRRLEDYSQEHDLPPPDIIKLDVQGFESAALSGASDILSKHSPSLIVEASFQELYVNQCLFSDVVTLLSPFGYEVKALGCDTPTGGQLIQADVLFEKL